MKTLTTITTLALLLSLGTAGCVAQVGQPEEKTGTNRSSLGNGKDDEPDPGDPGGEQSTDDKAADPGNNSTSGDNQGPQPLPWNTTGGSSPSGGSENKK